jgi:hypothetical protein
VDICLNKPVSNEFPFGYPGSTTSETWLSKYVTTCLSVEPFFGKRIKPDVSEEHVTFIFRLGKSNRRKALAVGKDT